ncbi:casein kinase I-like protein [Sarcoptes scabiei]|uniref:Casein kinase I-like protein n=1 Tax=Sarcoptes scabiei TaxID=52283 RepID=A0A132AAS1_SARSC|nr:casein kinase I-like protein [Sarcoptes scabiei]
MPGISKVFFFGECGPYNAMVLELLGPNLEDVLEANNSCFSVRTTTQIAIMILEIMRYVHSKKIIFCNVKPENFCLGRPNTPQANQIYMIGLINAKLFETSDSRHIPKNPGLTIISSSSNENATNGEKFLIEPKRFGVYGTPRYMSLNAHKGKELSRRDDLESIGYMLIYFIHGKLPWQGMPTTGQGYEHIYATKKMIQLDQLCANLPPEYYHYMLYTVVSNQYG